MTPSEKPTRMEEEYLPKSPFVFFSQPRRWKEYVPAHYHDSLEIGYYEGVTGRIYTEDRDIPISEGMAVVFPGNRIHAFDYTNSSGRALCCHIHFSRLNHYLNWESLFQQDELQLTGQMRISHETQVIQHIRDLHKNRHSIRLVLPHLLQLLPWLTRHRDEPPPEMTDRKYRKIINYIEAHYRENISLRDAAAHVGFTPSYLCRYIKKRTGKSFSEYLNEMRMKKFKIYLEQGLQVKEAGYKAGYNNISYCIRLFKRLYAATPRQWIAQRLALQKELSVSPEDP